MKLSHALLGLGAFMLLSGRSNGAPSPPPSSAPVASVNLNQVRQDVISSFVPQSGATLSPEGQLHNAISRAVGTSQKVVRDTNLLLSNQGLLVSRLQAGIGTAYLSSRQVVEIARIQFPNLTRTPRLSASGNIQGYVVNLNG